MKLKTMMMAAMMIGMSATAAMAFPSWMGVYGSIERHADGNPGTYTVLMNQDYWGLSAEVGVQVNGGSWQTHSLAYAGNQDGNSVWSFTPSQAYPAGATVNFYFHGWDNWGGNRWDSNSGANYSFVVESQVQFVGDWGSELRIPREAASYSFDLAAADGTLFAVWQEGGYWADGEHVPNVIMFSRKLAGHSWELPRQVTLGSYPSIAASSEGVFILYTAEQWPQTASLIRSTDLGNQWSSPVNDSFMTRYACLEAAGSTVYVAYDEFAAPETSDIYFRRMAVDASAWEPAHYVFGKSAYKSTVHVDDLDVQGNQVWLSTYSMSWYGGFSSTYFHESADAGQTWQEADHGLENVEIASDASGTCYVFGYESAPTGGSMRVAAKTAGSAWSAPALFQDGISTAAGLQVIGDSLVAVVGSWSQPMEYAVSPDGGLTWSALEPAGILGGAASVNVSDGADMHILFGSGHTLSTGAHGLGDPMQWAGNVSSWPMEGDLDADEFLWANLETWPAGTASEIYLVYSADGGSWQSLVVSSNGLNGNNDKWHAGLGEFAAGTHIQYAIQVIDNLGNVTWLNNNGQDYHITVNP